MKQKVVSGLDKNKPGYFFILDDNTRFLCHESNDSIALSDADVQQVLKSNLNFEAIIILAELNWSGKYLQHFEGFNIAIELRRKHKLLCPIIITSSLSDSYFEKLADKNPVFKILFSRGFAYIPLNRVSSKLKSVVGELNAYPLNIAVLTDMNEMLFNHKGVIIDKLTHDLRFSNIVNNLEKLKDVLKATEIYLTSSEINKLEWLTYSEMLLSNVSNAENFRKTADELIKKCERELFSNFMTESYEHEKRHKILVIEDDVDFQKIIKENLDKHFLELIITDNAENAIQIIKNDLNNSITGIISDWRLYKDFSAKTYWQLQGYEVLDFAAKNHFATLFALTSLSDYNVHNIRNALGLDIHLFKKQHLEISDSKIQWEMMADVVKQKCDNILDIIASQPTGNSWLKIKNEYIQKRSFCWDIFENEISNEATRILNYYSDAINSDETRNIYSLNEMGIVLKNDLTNILIGRRIYLGIYFTLIKTKCYLQDIEAKSLGDGSNFDTELKNHSIDVHSLLRKDWWDDINSSGQDSTKINDLWGNFDQRMKNLRGVLCIELTELPQKGMLPEEKKWLNSNGIDFSFLFNIFSD